MVFNSNDDNNDIYDALEQSVNDATESDKRDTGFLGYQDASNVFSVYSDVSRDRYRVRLDEGTNIDARHRGSVQPIPDLPVIIMYDEYEQPYIEGVDDTRQTEFAGDMSAQLGVGPHSHHRNSGMEFPIDPILMTYFQPLVESDRTISVQPGFYLDNGVPKWYTGGTIDLSSVLPPGGFHRWVMVLLEKSTTPPSLVFQNGSDKNETIALLESEVSQFDPTDTQVPLFMIKVRSDEQALNQRNIVSLSGASASGGTTTRGNIVTFDGLVVTVDGDVLRHDPVTDTVFTTED